MKWARYIGMVIGLSVATAMAQQEAFSPIQMDTGGLRLTNEVIDGRLDQQPLAKGNNTLRLGRELKQGEPVEVIPPPTQEAASSPRVRSRALLEEDRLRVKQAAALED